MLVNVAFLLVHPDGVRTDNDWASNMKLLDQDQIEELADAMAEDFGPNLDKDTFLDYALQSFEDIAGFETIDGDEIQTVCNQLWSKYHDR